MRWMSWKPSTHNYPVEIAEVAERLQAAGIYPSKTRVVTEMVGGNPYRIRQVFDALVERGDIVIRVPSPTYSSKKG